MNNLQRLLPLLILFSIISVFGKDDPTEISTDYLKMKWRHVATRMPYEWYGSDDAKQCAENVLITQKSIGGWAKNKPYHHPLSKKDTKTYLKTKDKVGATIDNRATTSEIRFLGKVYSHFKDERYKIACLNAIKYLLEAQYDNGGWPQFYPLKGGYADHITYNDDAMVDAMLVLKDVYLDSYEFKDLQLSKALKTQAHEAFDKGVECILKTQILVDGKRTVWCAQHDEKTFLPAKARSYELISFSGGESVKIVLLLMAIEHPSKEIKDAITGAVKWFEKHKITGLKRNWVKDDKGRYNLVMKKDTTAVPIWARFYDLQTEKPYFCDRDGVKKDKISEIGHERRNGYSWYIYQPQEILDAYQEWKAKFEK